MTNAGLSPHAKAIKHRGEFIYPIQVWYLNLSALALATLINVISILWAKLAPRLASRVSSAQRGRFKFIRVPAAVLEAWRIVAFRWRIPLGGTTALSLFEVFVVCIYMSALLIWEFVHTNDLDPNFWSNKASHIAAAQLPLLPALSAKNNVIGFLTGMSHERLNVLHRSAARCIYVLIWVHFWGRWRMGLTGADDIPNFPWQQVGATAGIAFTLTVILSLRPIRRWSYEIFYFTHVVMVIVFLIAACVHTTSPGFNYYIWPVFVVWGFDRVVRALRYLIINYALAPPKPAPSTAEITLITPDTLCVKLARYMPLGWIPGQHAFLSFPTVSAFPLESHPFSIAGIPQKGEDGTDELMFIIRARDGVTQRMLRLVATKPGVRVPVNIDAPYGMPTDLAPYRTCVLVAGGTGVSYTLPLLLDLVRRVGKGSALTKRIHFVWVLRSESFKKWMTPYLRTAIAEAVPGLDLQISIYVTDSSDKDSGDAGSEKSSRVDAALPSVDPGNTVQHASSPSTEKAEREASDDAALAEMGGAALVPTKGRPDIPRIIQGEIASGAGPLAIEVSGPATLSNATRKSVSHLLEGTSDVLHGGPTVNFHAETFKF